MQVVLKGDEHVVIAAVMKITRDWGGRKQTQLGGVLLHVTRVPVRSFVLCRCHGLRSRLGRKGYLVTGTDLAIVRRYICRRQFFAKIFLVR